MHTALLLVRVCIHASFSRLGRGLSVCSGGGGHTLTQQCTPPRNAPLPSATCIPNGDLTPTCVCLRLQITAVPVQRQYPPLRVTLLSRAQHPAHPQQRAGAHPVCCQQAPLKSPQCMRRALSMTGPAQEEGYEILASRTASKPGFRRKTWLLRGIGLCVLLGRCIANLLSVVYVSIPLHGLFICALKLQQHLRPQGWAKGARLVNPPDDRLSNMQHIGTSNLPLRTVSTLQGFCGFCCRFQQEAISQPSLARRCSTKVPESNA